MLHKLINLSLAENNFEKPHIVKQIADNRGHTSGIYIINKLLHKEQTKTAMK